MGRRYLVISEGGAGLTNIRSLDLYQVQVRDVPWLRGLKNLQSLTLYGAGITGVSAFPFLPNLQKLT